LYIIANATDSYNDLISVNFTITAPNGTSVINNVNATDYSGDSWNSSTFVLDQYGQWNYTIIVYDSNGDSDQSNGTIKFLEITTSLSDSTVNTGDSVTISGHINDSIWNDVTEYDIGIYINDSLINVTSGWNCDNNWWNCSWRYRKNISLENLVSTTINDTIVLVNFSTTSLISENRMNSNCGDIRFADNNDIELDDDIIEQLPNNVRYDNDR